MANMHYEGGLKRLWPPISVLTVSATLCPWLSKLLVACLTLLYIFKWMNSVVCVSLSSMSSIPTASNLTSSVSGTDILLLLIGWQSSLILIPILMLIRQPLLGTSVHSHQDSLSSINQLYPGSYESDQNWKHVLIAIQMCYLGKDLEQWLGQMLSHPVTNPLPNTYFVHVFLMLCSRTL